MTMNGGGYHYKGLNANNTEISMEVDSSQSLQKQWQVAQQNLILADETLSREGPNEPCLELKKYLLC